MAFIPGDGTTRHGFICVEDVAAFLVAACEGAGSGSYTIGGPEPLTFLDVVRVYEKLHGVTLRVRRTPAYVFRIGCTVGRLFSPALANLMCLNYLAATEEFLADADVPVKFGVALTSASAFLQAKQQWQARGIKACGSNVELLTRLRLRPTRYMVLGRC